MTAHRVAVVCAECGKNYQKRADRVTTPDYCCLSCRKDAGDRARAQRAINCLNCGGLFVPRIYQLKVGQGLYCSVLCSTTATIAARINPAAKAKAVATYKANGHHIKPKGQDSPYWTGGSRAATKRQTESGKAKARLAAYRAKNPEKVREWTQRRDNGMTGRLPRGTVSNLYRSQKGCCVYCHESLKRGYHVDHIMPIIRGGKHEPLNIQLLCPTCNLTKSARHPIDFAQMKGMLL